MKKQLENQASTTSKKQSKYRDFTFKMPPIAQKTKSNIGNKLHCYEINHLIYVQQLDLITEGSPDSYFSTLMHQIFPWVSISIR